MYTTVFFDRADLYERVWTTPLLKLATEIGVSDVAIGKACRRAGIPLPGRGYWAKDAGTRTRAPLGESPGPQHERIRFSVLDPELVAAAKSLRAARQQAKQPATKKAGAQRETVIAEPSTVAPPVAAVSELLDRPHSLIAKAQKRGARAKEVEGRLKLDYAHCLRVRTSSAAFDRALGIIDALVRGSESRGWSWKVTGKGSTVVECAGETISVELLERISRRDAPKPEPPKRLSRATAWSSYSLPLPDRYVWVPSGELQFVLHEYPGMPVRKSWSDGKRQRLEDKVLQILDGLQEMAAALAIKRERNAARKREWEAEEARRLQRARLAEVERLRRKRLKTALVDWERAERLRKFCDAVERTGSGRPGRDWLDWAREQADLLDPILRDSGTLFSLDVEVPSWFTGHAYYNRTEPDWWSEPEPE